MKTDKLREMLQTIYDDGYHWQIPSHVLKQSIALATSQMDVGYVNRNIHSLEFLNFIEDRRGCWYFTQSGYRFIAREPPELQHPELIEEDDILNAQSAPSAPENEGTGVSLHISDEDQKKMLKKALESQGIEVKE